MSVNTTFKDGKETIEARYFITSLTDIDDFQRSVRGHWAIESMHWHLDVTFKQDANKTSDLNEAQHLNNLRKLALGMLQALDLGKRMSLKKKRFALSVGFSTYVERLFEI